MLLPEAELGESTLKPDGRVMTGDPLGPDHHLSARVPWPQYAGDSPSFHVQGASRTGRNRTLHEVLVAFPVKEFLGRKEGCRASNIDHSGVTVKRQFIESWFTGRILLLVFGLMLNKWSLLSNRISLLLLVLGFLLHAELSSHGRLNLHLGVVLLEGPLESGRALSHWLCRGLVSVLFDLVFDIRKRDRKMHRFLIEDLCV